MLLTLNEKLIEGIRRRKEKKNEKKRLQYLRICKSSGMPVRQLYKEKNNGCQPMKKKS